MTLESKYCCEEEMEKVSYKYGDDKCIEYYQCVVNEQHEVFRSQADKNLLRILITCVGKGR